MWTFQKITTKYGKLLHTADWKIDSNPLLGDNFDKQSFKDLGNEGLLALIGDSTNANVIGYSKSEKEVKSEFKANYIRFNQNKLFLSFILLLLTIEWIARKNKGLS